MNILDFQIKKQKQEKISMVTCYDFSSAKILAKTKIDTLLVGDSLAMVMHGHPTTLPATNELMALHTAAVARGAGDKFIVADMPFQSFRKEIFHAVDAATMLMQAGAHAVKLEGAKGHLHTVKHLTEGGIPVMGHLGLTPQSIHQMGGFRVQGKTPEAYAAIIEDAIALEQAGAFCIVLECVPAALAEKITQTLKIPTIGIGAGSKTDGQVLVMQDLLGLNSDFKPKFVRAFLTGEATLSAAFNDFHDQLQAGQFPSEKESYL
jgi:3-methyl-2-oxobutanoate hydroxymethyltransferase